jgi:hypothetical protein
MTLIYDLDRSTVEAIAMDTSAAYVRSAKENIPLAEEKGCSRSLSHHEDSDRSSG